MPSPYRSRAGIEPPVKVTVFALFAIDPPQPLLLAAPTNVTPMGNVSVNNAKLAGVLLGLLKVMVRCELSPTLMGLGLKALLSVGAMGAGGGGTRTVKVSLAETVCGTARQGWRC